MPKLEKNDTYPRSLYDTSDYSIDLEKVYKSIYFQTHIDTLPLPQEICEIIKQAKNSLISWENSDDHIKYTIKRMYGFELEGIRKLTIDILDHKKIIYNKELLDCVFRKYM